MAFGTADLLGIGGFLTGVVDEFWYSDEEKAANTTAQADAQARQSQAAATVELARIQAESRAQTARMLLLTAGGLGLALLAYGLLKGD